MPQTTELPIDVVPGTNPPRFRWRQHIDSLAGPRDVICEGLLQVGADRAVVELIAYARREEQLCDTVCALLAVTQARIAVLEKELEESASKPTPSRKTRV